MVGINKEINVFKFRTMVVDSNNHNKYFTKEQQLEWKREHKVTNDPRITKIGKFLRATSIDEFPQFLHVISGKMSVIGPRVITKAEMSFFNNEDLKLLFLMKPGITGFWQVQDRPRPQYNSGKRQKLEIKYVKIANIKIDMIIIFKTIKVILTGFKKYKFKYNIEASNPKNFTHTQ